MSTTNFSPMNIDLLFCGNECNLICNHCFYKEKGKEIYPRGISSDLKIAKELIGKFSGSSIFVYPKEITTSTELISLLPSVGQTKVLSNGIALDSEMLEEMKRSGVTEIKITLFANHKTQAIFNCCTDSQYRSIIKNIRLCKNMGFRVVTEMVISTSTIPTIADTASLSVDLGADKIEFLRLKPVGAGRKMDEHELVWEPEMLKVVEKIEKLKFSFPQLRFGYNMSFGPDFYKKTLSEAAQKVARCKSGDWVKTDYLCPSIGMNYGGISLRTGKIYGCFYAMDEEDFILGYIDLKKNEVMSLRKDFLNPQALSDKLFGNCSKDSCKYHNICLGGCRSTAYLFAKKLGIRDPFYAGMDVCITKCKEKIGL